MSNSSSMADIAGLAGTSNDYIVKNSTSRKGNTELNMEDFLQLMIVQLQSQTIDDTMDTSEMMNQMVQMQMITAITNMTETSITSYASSLVGKVVTIGVQTDGGVEERVLRVMGTGVLNGQQVIFCSDGEAYALNQIMAVGYLPNEDGTYGDQSGSTVTGPDNSGDVDGSEEGKLPDDRPVEGTDETEDTPDSGNQEDDTVAPAAAVE